MRRLQIGGIDTTISALAEGTLIRLARRMQGDETSRQDTVERLASVTVLLLWETSKGLLPEDWKVPTEDGDLMLPQELENELSGLSMALAAEWYDAAMQG